MTLNNISFGKKIPQTLCHVYDTKEKRNIQATVYEYDCKDCNDSDSVFYAKNLNNYGEVFANSMDQKYKCPELLDDVKFYTLEDKDEHVIGIMQCNINKNDLGVALLEAENQHRYKFVGTMLLASMAKQLKKFNKDALTILYPREEAVPFYIDKCGFKIKKQLSTKNILSLEIKKDKIEDFINNSENKVHGKIIDLNV